MVEKGWLEKLEERSKELEAYCAGEFGFPDR
jgi:hypothetical protein